MTYIVQEAVVLQLYGVNYDNRCSAILFMMSAVRIRNFEII